MPSNQQIFEQYLKENIFSAKGPKILYHATFGANLESIKHFGLTTDPKIATEVCWPGNTKGIYLSNDPNVAESFVEAAENDNIPEDWFDDIVVLKINTSKLDLSKLEVDPHVTYEKGDPTKSYIYKDIISPAAISK